MFTSFTSTAARTVVGTLGMAVCAGVCLLGATAPAQAATVRTAAVRYADLDVRAAAGRAALAARVARAAHTVCTSADAGLAARLEESRCVRRAVTAVAPVVG